jgi:hypothetical protein
MGFSCSQNALKEIIKSEFIKLKNIKKIPQTFCLRDFFTSLPNIKQHKKCMKKSV